MDTRDFEKYFEDLKEETRRDYRWLNTAAFLLGSRFALESLKPHGPRKHPSISKVWEIRDIPNKAFRNIIKMTIDIDHYHYLYSEKELNTFKQLSEELRHHGRLEDPRTIENTAMRWMKQKNKLLSDFGSVEAYRRGALNVYTKASQNEVNLKIPWTATGKNPCRTCLALDGMLFDPEDFPPPPHFHCRCNNPMADPIIDI